MMRRLWMAALLLAAGAGTSSHLLACGDKFLVVGRGIRYERSAAARQASAVLIYARPASELSLTMARLSVEPALLKAGYKTTTVASEGDLLAAVRGQRYDLVLLDGQDTAAVSQLLQGGARPDFVPVFHRPTKPEVTAAKQRYRVVLKDPRKSRAFIDTIDEAMDSRDSESKVTARKTTS